uniref:Basic leucine-zipper C-terminal domain-containing protein n=1 Tax=Daucus carota subsp. sativus TaxID=79200 RepID=A0A164Z6D9_DAUCS
MFAYDFGHSSLLKHLTDISQRYNDAAVDNRVLKANIETITAKLPKRRRWLKRLLPSYSGGPSDTSADTIQDVLKQHFYQPAPMSHLHAQDQRAQNGLLLVPPVNNSQKHSASGIVEGNKIERTSSMQRVASLEHLQKGIRGVVSSSETLASGKQ